MLAVVHPTVRRIDYAYDPAGNRTELATTAGTVAYGFDALNRLSTVTDANGTVTYRYDAVGNRAAIDHANGNTTAYSYDSLNRLVELTHLDVGQNVVGRYTYVLGPAGRRLSLTEHDGRVVRWEYDDLHRLTQEQVTDPFIGSRTTSWTYDAVGNRLTQVEDDHLTNYGYDDNDRLLSETGTGGTTTYGHDDNGNTLSRNAAGGNVHYGYDVRNRLVHADDGGVVSHFTYDADGIRRSRSVDGRTTSFLIDSNRNHAQVIEEWDDNGQLVAGYLHGDDLLRMDGGEGVFTYLYDGLGSTRLLTDEAGLLSNRYVYKAFGELEAQAGGTSNAYLFAGEQFDNALNQYYLRARHYDQGVGRFTQMDEWQGTQSTPITLNNYLYADADPVNRTDPSGYFALLAGTARNADGLLMTTARASVRVWSGKKKGKAVDLSKQVGCYAGYQYVNARTDRVEGHHPLQRSVGGPDEQVLLFTARRTHKMLHTVQNMIFRERGLPPLNKGKMYFDDLFSRDPMARRAAFMAAIKSARAVDEFCGYKGKKSFERHLRREIRRWLKIDTL